MRCELCVHYTGGTVSDDFRIKLAKHIDNVYSSVDAEPDSPGLADKPSEIPTCPGCGNQEPGKSHPCGDNYTCDPMKCAVKKGLKKCLDCDKFGNSCMPHAGYRQLEPKKSISHEDVTWAILPYVHEQYGN